MNAQIAAGHDTDIHHDAEAPVRQPVAAPLLGALLLAATGLAKASPDEDRAGSRRQRGVHHAAEAPRVAERQRPEHDVRRLPREPDVVLQRVGDEVAVRHLRGLRPAGRAARIVRGAGEWS